MMCGEKLEKYAEQNLSANYKETKMTTRKEVYAAIDSERRYQDHLKKDRTSNPTDGTRSIDHTVGDFVTMMQQYQNNLVAAWTNNPGDQKAMEVMRKIAGIAVNCMEQHGVSHRGPGEFEE